MKKIKKRRDLLTELFFPSRCPICDEVVPFRHGLVCRGCFYKLKPIEQPYCFRCGRPVAEQTKEYCDSCGEEQHFYTQGRALYVYEDVAGAVYRFKYGKRQEYAAFFGREMAEKLAEFIKSTGAQGLVPVPLSKQRFHKRGYNQAGLLAAEMSERTGIPLYDRLVVRVRDTVPQKELNANERQNNLKKAFKIAQNDVKLSTIIIIDDIYTTGSTVDEIAKLLHRFGIKKIYVIALAIAAGQ